MNQKIKLLHIEKFFELREKHHMSYNKIAEAMTIKTQTVYYAMKRFAARGGVH